MTEPVLSGNRFSGVTVLVIDDELSMARATSRLLHSMGLEVLSATAGQEAIEICHTRGEEIDVVLLDVVMREMSSVETLQQIRSLRPGIKVILMSGFSKQESMNSFAGKHLNGFVSKPFDATELENAILAALGCAH